MSTHTCDDDCVCPTHRTPLYYAPASNDHACQDASCEWGAGGCNPARRLLGRDLERRTQGQQRPWPYAYHPDYRPEWAPDA